MGKRKVQIEAVKVENLDNYGSVMLAGGNFKVRAYPFFGDDAFEVAEFCRNVIENCNGNYGGMISYVNGNNVVFNVLKGTGDGFVLGEYFTLKRVSACDALACAETIRRFFKELPELERKFETDLINADDGTIKFIITGITNTPVGYTFFITKYDNVETVNLGTNLEFAQDTRDFIGAIIEGCKGNVDEVTIGFGSIEHNALVLADVGNKVLTQIYSDDDAAKYAAEIIDKVFDVIRNSYSDNKKAAL